MPHPPDKTLSPREKKRVDTFLDCVARLLAKRWLRDQQEVEAASDLQERPDGKPQG